MWRKTANAAFTAAFLLASLANALPHGDDHLMDDMNMDMGGHGHNTTSESSEPAEDSPMSYFAYGKHSGTVIAHIGLMVLAWCFILPAGENLFTNVIILWISILTIKTNRCHAQCRALAVGASHSVRVFGF